MKRLIDCTVGTPFAKEHEVQELETDSKWKKIFAEGDGKVNVTIRGFWSKNDRCDGNITEQRMTPSKLRHFLETRNAICPGKNGATIYTVDIETVRVYSGYRMEA